MTELATNALDYGDNLDILRKYISDESVDLIYLDPPFNSNATYNVIFKDESGNSTDAQLVAFDDTWHWGPDAESKYLYLTNTAYHQGKVPSPVSDLIGAFHSGIKPSPMLAYLVEMAVRLVELHRVLKPTGSIWLHCDPTASHYLKLVLDAIWAGELPERDRVAADGRTRQSQAVGATPRHHPLLLQVRPVHLDRANEALHARSRGDLLRS